MATLLNFLFALPAETGLTTQTETGKLTAVRKASSGSRTGRSNGQTVLPKKRILFIPASIRSHVIPILYVADLLADNYDIFYAVTNQVLADIVSENGYTPVMNDHFRIAVGMEQSFLLSRKKKAGFWQVLRSVYTNELYRHRKQTVDELMTRIQPDAVIIDVFSSTDFLALYDYRSTVRLLFCNPMLSTYRVGSLPIVSEGGWPRTAQADENPAKFSLKRFITNPRAELYGAALRYQLKELLKPIELSSEHRLIKTPFTRLFENVPELLLAPLEFELSPDVRKPYQHYLGLCIREQRIDTELDADFARQWPSILSKRQLGERIIYCSFGTFYTGSDKALLDLVTNLLEAIADIPNVQLVCSVHSLVIETLKSRQASVPNVHFFKRVPQLTVLEAADVHITHGGLGSVKESILYGVPMLVYPLDLHYDQNGNGLKVEHHGLGLRGEFSWERTVTMKDKISRLLNDDTFRMNISHFGEKCAIRYATDEVENTLAELLTVPAP